VREGCGRILSRRHSLGADTRRRTRGVRGRAALAHAWRPRPALTEVAPTVAPKILSHATRPLFPSCEAEHLNRPKLAVSRGHAAWQNKARSLRPRNSNCFHALSYLSGAETARNANGADMTIFKIAPKSAFSALPPAREAYRTFRPRPHRLAPNCPSIPAQSAPARRRYRVACAVVAGSPAAQAVGARIGCRCADRISLRSASVRRLLLGAGLRYAQPGLRLRSACRPNLHPR